MQNFEIDFSELDKELKEKLNLNDVDECLFCLYAPVTFCDAF